MKKALGMLAIVFLVLGVSSKSQAFTTVGYVFKEIFQRSIYKVYGLWEYQVLKKQLGLTVESCEVRYMNRNGISGLESSERSSLSLCVYEHLMQQMFYPEQAVDILVWAKFQNQPVAESAIPFRMILKIPPIPEKTLLDFVTFGITYDKKLFQHILRWKDADITLESTTRPLPLDLFLPNNQLADLALRAASKREEGTEKAQFSKINFRIKTALKNESLDPACNNFRQIDSEQSRICMQISVFGLNTYHPTLEVVGQTNWTLRGQLSREFEDINLQLELNPDARIEITPENLETLP